MSCTWNCTGVATPPTVTRNNSIVRAKTACLRQSVLATLATLVAGVDYPRRPLEIAWKQVLFNQFHDILPGTSIGAVFDQANQDWQAALTSADQVLHHALAQLASHCPLPPAPLSG
jgi:alpha-mannosidase